MTRTTIDFGIDLGTTNSEIAVLKGTQVHVFRSNAGDEYTPSAVWIDRQKNLIVGRRAKDQQELDPENAFVEFKRVMGQSEVFVPKNDPSRRLRPEDLSAEVLKSLKANVRRDSGEDVRAAVITIPAAFDEPQCAATRRAAQAAGLEATPLLQEPIAAALSYGFQTDAERAYWLVYDLGGGTFDAALVQLRDGALQVVNHGGDNHLGGKDLDWAIVNHLLVPEVLKEHRLPDFRRGVERWRRAFAKLKAQAEKAKIELSSAAAGWITEDLCEHDGRIVRLEVEVKKADLERLMDPILDRSIDICRKVLSEKRLASSHVERLILVGGPTLSPYLRERLEDATRGLGIRLEFGVDPLTVVARGAAVFARTQRLDPGTAAAAPAPAGALVVDLQYKPIGPDTEPLVGGRVKGAAGEDLSRHTIEFVNAEARPAWRSGKVGLSRDGAFMTTLWAEKGRENTFRIEVVDATGRPRPTSPESFTYQVGKDVAKPPAPHSIGVALADNEVEFLIRRGTPLPARGRWVGRTNSDVRRGDAAGAIRIPIVEGENRRADRNRRIGELSIAGDRLKRDVPVGSEVEIRIDMDESRAVTTQVYVPILDDEYEMTTSLEKAAPDLPALSRELAETRRRLEEARRRAQETRDAATADAVARIDRSGTSAEIEEAITAGRDDRDAGDKARSRLEDLRAEIDRLEEMLEWPAQVQAAENEVEVERKIVDDSSMNATREEKDKFSRLEREIRAAIQARDGDVLKIKVREMDALGYAVVTRNPGWWVAMFERLEGQAGTMTDRSRASAYVEQGRRAIHSGNVDALKNAVSQLASLLPHDGGAGVAGLEMLQRIRR
jgi:molecular chaperone DnaK